MDATTTTTYRRGELYEQVWTEPMTTVAARFGVSSVALGKMCRKLGVPSPPRGYWAKKKFGHTSRRPPLPALRDGQKEEITTRRRDDPHAEAAGSGVAPDGPNPEVVVMPTLERPHDLVAATARDLRKAKPSYDGMVYATRSDGRLDVHVAPDSVDRAMRIADALLKACKRHSIAIEFASLEPKGGWQYRSNNRELEHQTCLRIHVCIQERVVEAFDLLRRRLQRVQSVRLRWDSRRKSKGDPAHHVRTDLVEVGCVAQQRVEVEEPAALFSDKATAPQKRMLPTSVQAISLKPNSFGDSYGTTL